jgi:hypothetical protein
MKTGNEIISLKYDSIESFSEGLAAVRLNGRAGFIDKTGREIISLTKYDWADSFSEGLAGVRLNGKWGFIDKTGKEVIPLKYNIVLPFSEGVAEVRVNYKIGLIDKTGKEIFPPKYDKIWCEAFRKQGFIGVTLNGKKGFVDIYGNEYFDF